MYQNIHSMYFSSKAAVAWPETYSEPDRTSDIELFGKVVYGSRALTNFAEILFLDV